MNPLPACARLTSLLPHKCPHVSPAQEWCNLAPQAFQDILGCVLEVKGAFILEQNTTLELRSVSQCRQGKPPVNTKGTGPTPTPEPPEPDIFKSTFLQSL